MIAWWLAEHAAEAAEGGQAAHEAAGSGAAHAEHHIPELPNLIGVLHELSSAYFPSVTDRIDNTIRWLGFNDPMGTPLTAFENVVFALLVILALGLFFYSSYRRLRREPPREGRLSRRALFSEVVVLFFEDFFTGILGKKEVHRHLPLVGTLFIYILCCNTLGLVFLGKAPTANLSFNVGMALVVFLYVHITGLSRSPLGYLRHYPGELPTMKELGLGPIGLVLIGFMAILFSVIHVLEAAIQPVSLSLRLFGNVLGKDVLLGVFGSLMLIPIYAGISVAFPWHTPFLFLGLLLGLIQALIFSLLSAVYIMLWLPHGDGAEEHA